MAAAPARDNCKICYKYRDLDVVEFLCKDCKSWTHINCCRSDDIKAHRVVRFLTNYKFSCSECTEEWDSFCRTPHTLRGVCLTALANLHYAGAGYSRPHKTFSLEEITDYIEKHWEALTEYDVKDIPVKLKDDVQKALNSNLGTLFYSELADGKVMWDVQDTDLYALEPFTFNPPKPE